MSSWVESIIDLGELRPTRAIVDLDVIASNTRALQAMVPKTTKVMAVVKADGYGHGAPWIADAALDAGAASLGVATVSEGQELRAFGLTAPIVLLGSIDPSEARLACRAGLQITVADGVLLDAVQDAARNNDVFSPVTVHLKIDTGLRRYGALPEEASALAVRIAADPYLRLAGVFTHFASADEPEDPFTDAQLREFESALSAIRDAGVDCSILHAANSAGIVTGRGAHYGMVRAGIALYGVPPSADVALPSSMLPALRIESRITRIIPIEPGDSVGYNRTFRSKRATRGALIPIGYGDGYRRSLAARGWVAVGCRRAAVLGRVSMDQIVVEVPQGVSAATGDRVHVLGGDPALGAPSVGEIADLTGTNTYEVLVGLRRRIPRVFVKNGEVVGIRSLGME